MGLTDESDECYWFVAVCRFWDVVSKGVSYKILWHQLEPRSFVPPFLFFLCSLRIIRSLKLAAPISYGAFVCLLVL